MSRAGSNATAERPQRRTTPPTRVHHALLRAATGERRRNKSELKLQSIFSRTLRISRPRRGIPRSAMSGLRRSATFNHPRQTSVLVKGFGRRPLRRWGMRRGRRLKASQGGNREEVGGAFGERAYGDLRIADGWRARRRRSAALGVFSGSGGGGRFRWRRCAGARRWPRSQEDLRPRAGVAPVFRRAAGGEEKAVGVAGEIGEDGLRPGERPLA